MKIAVLAVALFLSGCSFIPSFSDVNQSKSIIDIRLAVDNIDCSLDQHKQALELANHINWFMLYSESKGMTQRDVIELVSPMKSTTEEWVKRSASGASVPYCNIKKQLLVKQSDVAARAVLRRF